MAIGSFVDVLNQWNQMGVFSYVLPFLLVFALVYGLMSKIKVFEGNNAVNAIVALAIGLLSLQLDFVPTFFQQIFPKFGIGLSILLVFVIAMSFFLKDDDWNGQQWMGWIIGIGVILWAISSWEWGGDQFSIGYWLQDNFWALIIGIVIIVGVYFMVKNPSDKKESKKT